MRAALAALALALAPATGFAGSTLTAVGTGGSEVLVGVRTATEPGAPPVTSIVAIDAASLATRALPLPDALEGREVVALLPAGKNGDSWLVVTQSKVEQGDEPQIHQLAPAKKKWTKLGSVACPAMVGLTLSSGKLSFRCEEGAELPQPRIVEKSIAIKPSVKKIELTFPQAASSRGGVDATLEGTAPDWDRVRIKRGTSDESLGVEKLLPTRSP